MATTVKGNYPHVEWVDLYSDGTLHECAIVKRDPADNLYFFEVTKLDSIDKQRLFNIITDRNAPSFELWDLMSQKTLGNGQNALAYFHQLVKVLTPSGKIINPQAGMVGAGKVTYAAPTAQARPQAAAEAFAETPAAPAAPRGKR